MRTWLKTFGTLLGLAGASSACGQATFLLNNRVVGVVDAPMIVCGGIRASGTEYRIALYGGPAGTPESALTQQGASLPFRTGTGAGYINVTGVDSTRAIAGTTDGGMATVQLRYWQTSAGDTYEAARAAGGFAAKTSALTLAGGGGQAPPAALTGLTSWDPCWPEPGTGLLACLGASVLALCRRAGPRSDAQSSRP